jgi:poly(3-hydroxybutyrate) depolymerase
VNASVQREPASFEARTSSGLLDSWIEGWEAAFVGLATGMQTVLSRGPEAFYDLPRWLELTSRRERPAWHSPQEIVFETRIARLRDFSKRHRHRKTVPSLVIPPQAGHDSCIVDYSPQQSQMRAIVASGLSEALALDWVPATPATGDASIEEYLDVIDEAVDHCGGQVNLIGNCQGGWLATIYAALAPERVNTLTLAGGPIDFHAGDAVIHELLRRLAPGGDLSFFEALVGLGGGVLKGEHMLAGFVMIQPSAEISRHLELIGHLDDPDYVSRYREFEAWFKHTQDIPGAFYLWIVRNLFRDNALIAGRLEARGRQVDLAKINMPLNLLAGQADHITPPAQVYALADYASTPSELVRRGLTRGGHLGLFMSHEALREHWPPLLRNVLEHSAPRSRSRQSS